MFYTIEITVWSGNKSSSIKTVSEVKRTKLFWKDELINIAVNETDQQIIYRLNHFYKNCEFDFVKAFREYGITFWANAVIHNRLTGKSDLVYSVEWVKDHWNLKLQRHISQKLKFH